jgi:integrase
MLVLTGARLREVGNATWSEIDFDARLWRIPANRTKNKRPHEIPLSNQAVALLRSTPRIAGRDGFIFTFNGKKPVTGFSWAKEQIDRACTVPLPQWQFHDFRRSMGSGMARLGVPLPTIEKVLNHTSGSFAGIVGVYQRHDFAGEKRAALQAWSDHVERLIGGESVALLRTGGREIE